MMLALFAKPPVPGRVKTRLARDVGPAVAAQVYSAFIADLVEAHRDQTYRTVLHVTEPGMPPELTLGLACRRQRGADLGERMRNAVADSGSPTVIIGTDLPTVRPSDVHGALSALATHDLVLGPAADGGYWLIAMSRPLDVFAGVPWSTDGVLAATLARAAERQLRVQLLDRRVDVDTLADLRELAAAPALPPHTHAVLRGLAPGLVPPLRAG
ncbi:MAG: rSAM/selenodomain-associated transferase 1 [Myxococcota bacterium]|jgi:rSAM/selenodomain-associated transferase 1